MTLWQLSYTFFLIGLFTIGGGQVAITLMYQPVVEGGLLSAEKFYNMIAISESTPGPIGINMATYIGCELFGIFGGIVVTFSTILPSLIIIIIIAKYFEKYQEKPIVKTVFSCVKPVSTGLIAVAAWQVFAIAVINFNAIANGLFTDAFSIVRSVFYIVALILLFTVKLSPVVIILLGAVFGVMFL
ncbi:MAG: chromate transporter [Spirochaetaceae bacterium]|nr:chromate transporter [Spirochaetaceae bacterium]